MRIFQLHAFRYPVREIYLNKLIKMKQVAIVLSANCYYVYIYGLNLFTLQLINSCSNAFMLLKRYLT